MFLGDNVLFSAAYGSQGLLQFWESARRNAVLLLTSAPAVEEARRNLDRPVLPAAIQARATHFVTGDTRHFGPYRLRQVGGVLICTPRDYVNRPQPRTDVPGE